MGFAARWVGALGFGVCMLAGWEARAEGSASEVAPGAAEIQLKNGSTMRGTIVEIEPGQRVIVIVAGEQSVIPWGEIAQIVDGPAAAPASPAAASPAPASPAPAAPTMGMPFVRIESNWPDVELLRSDGSDSRFVCHVPCNKLVDGREGHRFSISGEGMESSPSFRLEGYDGHVTARVTGVSSNRFMAGLILTNFGGIVTLSGSLFTAIGFGEAGPPTKDTPDPEAEAAESRTTGLVFLGLGAPALIAGIVVLATQGSTRVEIVETRGSRTGVALDNGILRF